MSNAVYPVLPGLTPIGMTRTPTWSTTVKTALSLREYRAANATWPIYHYKIQYEFLRQKAGLTELATLAGFYNARQGSFDSFLFTDPEDNHVTLQAIGIGDGINTAFQLVRAFGGALEPVYDVNSAPLIYVAGALKAAPADYSIGAGGLLLFVVPPASGLVVTWTGSFYRRVRFLTDSVEFSKLMWGLWEVQAGALELITVKP